MALEASVGSKPDVLADRHAGNDLLDSIALLGLLEAVQRLLQLKDLACRKGQRKNEKREKKKKEGGKKGQLSTFEAIRGNSRQKK